MNSHRHAKAGYDRYAADELLKAEMDVWLRETIRVYPTPRAVTLRQISLDRHSLRGNMLVQFDEAESDLEIAVSPGGDGWLGYSFAIFFSALGAPASFGAVKVSDATANAVTRAVRSLLPRLLAFGLHPVTREWVTQITPLRERVRDIAAFEKALDRVTAPGFACTELVDRA